MESLQEKSIEIFDKDYLGRNDLMLLLTLSHRSLMCRDMKSFKKLIMELSALIGFEYVNCARSKIPDVFFKPGTRIDHLEIHSPSGYVQAYLANRLYLTDATTCTFLANLEPVHWKTHRRKINRFAAADLAFDYGMQDGWTYGVVDTATMHCTQFTMSRTTADDCIPRSRVIIEYITPFMAEAYRRILEGQREDLPRLTLMETEVLQWLKEGKTSWEISMILNCSRRVVDFHVQNIKKKLNCLTRAQVIAVAMHHKITGF